MSVFQRGNVWWYTFRFKGMRVQESTSSASKNLAIKADKRPKTFSVHSTKYLKTKELKWSDANRRIEGYNVNHLTEFFGKMLLTDITAAHISEYQVLRNAAGASGRTINMEIGTLRAMLRKEKLWANLQPDVEMLRARSDIGRALSRDEEKKLLDACRASRSRSLYPAVLLSIQG